MDEVVASLKMSLSFDPTTLIEIAVYKTQVSKWVEKVIFWSEKLCRARRFGGLGTLPASRMPWGSIALYL